MLKKLELPDEGQSPRADEGHRQPANARQPHGDGEAMIGVPEGQPAVASPSPDNLKPSTRAAREALLERGLDHVGAEAALVAAAVDDEALRDDLLRVGARWAVDAVTKDMRQAAWSPDAAIRTARQAQIVHDDPGRVATLAKGNLLAFPLPNGKLLGDAIRSEVQLMADGYQAREVDSRVKRRWLAAIVKGLPNPDSKVSAFFTGEKLQKLKEEALTHAIID